MPQLGFICPQDNKNVNFDFCLQSCPSPCHPLPVLAAMINERESVPGTYHVTEILNPPKVVYRSRHSPYYLEPEANAYAALGTAYHLMMETGERTLAQYGVKDQAAVEFSFSARIKTAEGEATLTGRIDRYEPGTRAIWDYKTEKLYSVKKYLAGNWEGCKHLWQQNIYRTYGFPEAEHLWLSCFVKDHGYAVKVNEGIRAIVNVRIPILASPFVEDFVEKRIAVLLKNEKDPSTIPDCQAEDLWGGRRCREYCPALASCVQGQRVVEGTNNGDHPKRKTRR